MTGKATPGRIAARERVALAIQLRRDGSTLDEVAAHIGPDGNRLYASRQGASRAILREMRRIPREVADDARMLELARLDALHARAWPDTEPGPVLCTDHGEALRCPECGQRAHRGLNVGAAGVVLRTMERRSALLGLDFRDGLAERAVAVLEEQVQMVAAAVRQAIDQTDGLDAVTADALVRNIGEALRRMDEDEHAERPLRLSLVP